MTYYNWGRWVVDCPCGSALAVSESGVEVCRECRTLLTVVIPDYAADIERVCAYREPRYRNWLPGETVETLEAENVAHGVYA